MNIETHHSTIDLQGELNVSAMQVEDKLRLTLHGLQPYADGLILQIDFCNCQKLYDTLERVLHETKN